MNILDAFCLEIISKFKKGELSKADAERKISEHDNKLIVHLYAAGFTVRLRYPSV